MSTVAISQASRNLSHWINKACYGTEAVVFTSRGRPKAVMIGVESFQKLLGGKSLDDTELLSVEELQMQFAQALAEAGHVSDEDIVALVRDVRREMVDERYGAV